MDEEVQNAIGQEHGGVSGEWLLAMFDKSPVNNLCLRRIREMLGMTLGLECLAIGGVAAMHYYLRAHGGSWHNADMTEEGVANIISVLSCPPRDWEPQTVTRARAGSHNVQWLDGATLPYADGSFDRVVLMNGLEGVENDYAFIAECHRVMKNSGHLILNVTHAKPWTLLAPLRRMLGMTDQQEDDFRGGYSKTDLFNLLKDG
ncbi:MAG: class I SAM-dependent methyltransferase, partial [Spartobacteria bacterium]|nr:class I SAM-dependent methyltransferase [Spartobacteria bacterium]